MAATKTMKIRETILGAYVAICCLSCVRDKPNEADAGAAAPPPMTASAPAKVEAAAPPPAPTGPFTWDDKNELPPNDGDRRCKDPLPAKPKTESMKLELIANPPGIALVVPALSIQQQLSGKATECRASLVAGGSAYRVRCTEEPSGLDGKVYARKSDIVFGRASATGATNTKFILPCGTVPKLEPIVCPKDCKKTGDDCICGKPAP